LAGKYNDLEKYVQETKGTHITLTNFSHLKIRTRPAQWSERNA